MVSEPPRPSVVTSLVSWLTPWNPATSTMRPSSSAACSRPGVTSMIFALPWVPVVMTPACEPVNERAWAPSDSIAMATSALEIRSPAVSSMSSSRGRRGRADLLGQVHQVVGGVPHRGDHHDDVVPLLLGRDDALGDAADPIGVGHRGSAVLLHDERHVILPAFFPPLGTS